MLDNADPGNRYDTGQFRREAIIALPRTVSMGAQYRQEAIENALILSLLVK
jgi:hypothetical protein